MIKQIHKKGFTLIEIILSITLIGILAGISFPLYQTFQIKNDLNIAANEIIKSLRRAQILSETMDYDSSWGLKIETQKITLFQGENFSNREKNFDEQFELPPTISNPGISEIVFSKLYGEPNAWGTITLTSTNNSIKNILINEKGAITY